MKKFLKENGIWVLVTAIIIAVILNLVVFFGGNSTASSNVLGVITKPFRSLTTTISTWVNDRKDTQRKYEELQDENEELRKQIADLEKQVQQSQEDAKENQRLRNLLGLKEQRYDLTGLLSAQVIDRSSSNWDSTITLDVGSTDNIAVGMCAIDEYGYLIGMVSDVGTNWCHVDTILSPSLSFGTQVFRSGEACVASGDYSLLDSNELKISYIDEHTDIKPGDLIVTSGVSGVYPRRLSVGTVADIRSNTSGQGSYAIIRPLADIDSIEQVFIITSFEVVR